MRKVITGTFFYKAAPDRLEMRRGGGCLSLFGLPFFMAGLFMLMISIAIIPMSNATQVPWWALLIVGFMGIVFSLVGGALIFSRIWTTIDSTQQKIWVSWGLLRPMRTTIYQLSNYDTVIIGYKAGDSDSSETYPISLKSIDPGRDLVLCEVSNYADAVMQGSLLSEFLRYDLEDLSSDHALEKTAPDSKVLLPKIEAGKEPPVPANLRSRIVEEDNRLLLTIPSTLAPGLGYLQFIIPLLMLIVFGRIFFGIFRQTDTPVVVQMAFGGFFLVFFIVIPLITVIAGRRRSSNKQMQVSLDREGISLDNGGNKANDRKFIARDRIVAVDYNTAESAYYSVQRGRSAEQRNSDLARGIPDSRLMSLIGRFHRSKGVVIKSMDGVYYLGSGLSDEEVYYIFSRIAAYLDRSGTGERTYTADQ